jgi:hypothetical protein
MSVAITDGRSEARGHARGMAVGVAPRRPSRCVVADLGNPVPALAGRIYPS